LKFDTVVSFAILDFLGRSVKPPAGAPERTDVIPEIPAILEVSRAAF